MIDAEKVIRHIVAEISIAKTCKKDFALVDIDMLSDALFMLKEQEAVKPGKEHSSSGVTWWNVCGNCKTAINPNDKFCHECGKPILWEGR